jgi:N-formylglutamate amidohydrolase
MDQLPIVYSAHHASDDFGYKDFSERCVLDPLQRARFSDYGTDITVPQHGITPALIAQYSRGIVDLNGTGKTQFKDKDFAKTEDGWGSEPNALWLPGKGHTDAEKADIVREIYDPYYQQIIDDLRSLERHKYLLVFAWDNTADYCIGEEENGGKVWMPDFVVSNRGAENSANKDTTGACKGEETSCEPAFLEEFVIQLHHALKRWGLPDDVRTNLVYRGGNITRTFSHRRNPDIDVQAQVESLQLEYNTKITHDQRTLEPYWDRMDALRLATEAAMAETYKNVGPQLIGLPGIPESLS